MKTIFDPAVRDSLLHRLAALDPNATGRWGTLTLGRMLAHLADALRFAVGDRSAAPAAGFLSNRVVRWLAIVVFPWPHGTIRASRELLSTEPDSFEADRAALRDLVERFARIDGTPAPHPMLGDLSRDLWGRLVARHIDYHFRQFGA